MNIALQTIQKVITSTFLDLFTAMTLFLPRLLNALILLLLGWFLASLVSRLVGRLLTGLKFDHLVKRAGLEQALIRADVYIRPSAVLGRLIYWLVILIFVLAAVDALGLQAVAETIRELVSYIPKLIGAVFVVIGGGILARFFGQAAQTLAAGADLEFHRGLGAAVRYFLLALTFVLAAGQLGLEVSFLGDALANIVIVVIAALGLTFALSGRELVRNMLAGIYAKEIYELGQVVQLQLYEGTLEAIGTFKATIATTEEIVTVPNNLLINEVVTRRYNLEAALQKIDAD